MSDILCVGHAVEDHLFRVGEIPASAAKHQAKDFEVVGGGPAANAAVAIARLGGSARLAARVGDDAFGASIISDLESEGVDCTLVRKFSGRRTSLSAVLVDDHGQRMIVNYLDSDLPAAAEWMISAFPKNTKAVLADTRWPTGALNALTVAQDLDIPGVLDADHPIPQDGALLKTASHIAFSAQGLRAYAGDDDLQRALSGIAKQTAAWCCVTNGEDGVYIAHNGETDHVLAAKVAAVDTLAAGDIWHGAFTFALTRGEEEKDAVIFANAAAAIKVSRPGGRKGSPSLGEVEAFLERR